MFLLIKQHDFYLNQNIYEIFPHSNKKSNNIIIVSLVNKIKQIFFPNGFQLQQSKATL